MSDQPRSVPARLGLHELSYTYRRADRPALREIDADFSSSSIAVLGPNGAGKSTLFRILATLASPGAGAFSVDGADPHEPGRMDDFRARLGYLPQELRLFRGYTCEEFLRYVCWLRRVPAPSTEFAIGDALRTVDLESRRDQRISALSGGMVRRLGLAQALVSTPTLVLLDEPTTGLDPRQRAEFRDHLLAIRERAILVVATHLVEDVAAIAEDVLVLAAGEQRFAGTLTELCGTPSPTGADVEAAYLALTEPSR